MTEIEKFYNAFKAEISSRQFAEENGEFQEQSFTRICLDMLMQANETDNAVVAFDEKDLGTRNQHKINGYAISETCDTVDLFISIYNPSDSIENLDKQNVDRACTRITNFFSKAFNNHYENELAETSSLFEFSYQLANSAEIRNKLIRVNAFILTNARYKGETPATKEISGYNIFYNIIDIDKLYSISEQSRLPIHLVLKEHNVEPRCLQIPTGTDCYEGYLTFIPGSFLASLYQQYGFKLLEQNVRSFLQFRADINRRIKSTIINEPYMFFAYNNGISATAEEIVLDESNTIIKEIKNLQIVNGGQTTATLYYTSKIAQENLDKVLVPMKISVIKNADKSYEIVKHISKYANTQNKINEADLSANDPILVEIEKLSRYMLTPITIDSNQQHYWFFDRISRQYDNLLTQNSKTKSSKKAFSLKYPKQNKFTKYELAKFYNSYYELEIDGKIIVGPHCVVDGNEVNFRAFRDYVMPKLEINNIFYEDLIAKAILFKEVDRRHGTKRSATPPIGDMKQVMVPYSIALLRIATDGCLDLGKIWNNQKISVELSDYMYSLMVQLNDFLKKESVKTNIIEWATKEDCWKTVKEKFVIPDISSIKNDICSKEVLAQRYSDKEATDTNSNIINQQLVSSISSETWLKISEWGKDSGCLSLPDQNAAKNLEHKTRFGYNLNKRDIAKGVELYEITCRNNYEIFEEEISEDSASDLISKEQIIKMLTWEKTPIVLENWQFNIIQQAVNDIFISKFRAAELEYLRNKLSSHGF